MRDPLLLFVLIVAHASGLPITSLGTLPIDARDAQASKKEKEGLSDEVIIGIAAIFVSVVLSVIGIILAVPHFGRCVQRKQRTGLRKRLRLHQSWPRSRY
ncbi:hypothetical protein M3J09_004549 [Ascochyta lentis]